MVLNSFGKLVEQTWYDLANHVDNIILDSHVVMPGHFHCIIVLSNDMPGGNSERARLPEVIRQFKTFSARRINALREMQGVPVWQRNYFERIIRNNQDLMDTRKYIQNNPANWEQDDHYGRFIECDDNIGHDAP